MTTVVMEAEKILTSSVLDILFDGRNKDPDDALNNQIQGTVLVQFIVDKTGHLSEVQAISGPDAGGLRDEAVRVISKSGQWLPAIQNGAKVKSYKRQPVIFLLASQ